MWQDVQASLISFLDLDLLSTYGWRLLLGLKITVQVVLISCSIGFLLAFPISRARMSKNAVLSNLALAYISFFRGTPLLCQLYLAYYGSGEFREFFQQIGLWWFFRDAFFCCILAFTLNTAAYQAEILRGALGAVPKGQAEAAKALGLSPYRIARHVVWPQAILVALRPLGNELIGIIKASALAAIVTLLDLMGQTRFIFARTFDFSVYMYCALIYLAMTEGIRRAINRMERALSRHLHARMPQTMQLAGRAAGQQVSNLEAAASPAVGGQ
jgi:polar amino acid transport system permease protein